MIFRKGRYTFLSILFLVLSSSCEDNIAKNSFQSKNFSKKKNDSLKILPIQSNIQNNIQIDKPLLKHSTNNYNSDSLKHDIFSNNVFVSEVDQYWGNIWFYASDCDSVESLNYAWPAKKLCSRIIRNKRTNGVIIGYNVRRYLPDSSTRNMSGSHPRNYYSDFVDLILLSDEIKLKYNEDDVLRVGQDISEFIALFPPDKVKPSEIEYFRTHNFEENLGKIERLILWYNDDSLISKIRCLRQYTGNSERIRKLRASSN